MARYRYEALSPEEFEGLVIEVCRVLLGESTRGFSSGPDGGRDARFDGTANDFPSHTAPWTGTTIIQAKHTKKMNASFSDSDFLGRTGILAKELPKIEKLAREHKLDHYMLFANRRLTGGADDKIIERISKACGLDVSNIHICGLEELDQQLAKHGNIAEAFGLENLAIPLPITRDDLAEVIEAIYDKLGQSIGSPNDNPVKRTSLESKNALNGVSKAEIEPLRKLYLKDTAVIDKFLSNPINQKLLDKYVEATEELNICLPMFEEQYGSFMGAYHAIRNILLSDYALRHHGRLANVVLFYMYWNCDFGRSEGDDNTAQ